MPDIVRYKLVQKHVQKGLHGSLNSKEALVKDYVNVLDPTRRAPEDWTNATDAEVCLAVV